MNAVESLPYFIPELILLGTALAVLLLDLFIAQKKFLTYLGLAGILTSLVLLRYPADPLPLFYGFFIMDPFSLFFKGAALGITALTLLASLGYRPGNHQKDKVMPYFGEYNALFLFLAFGLILMGSSNNLLMIFLSIEFVSILSYLLTGFLKKNPRSKEAALKYLLFGSASSGIMLFGMSLLFGLTGEIDLNLIHAQLASREAPPALILTAFLLLLAGLGFKISMAPFHMWAPDVYEGAPTPVTGFLTVGPKALGFSLLLRVLQTTFLELHGEWGPLLAALSMLTMTFGNVIAVSQTNLKRLLAYSSIAQAGYILMGAAVSNPIGLAGVLIYLLAYVFTNLGAFLCVILVSNNLGSDDLEAYRGLSERSPFLAASLTLFMLSLAGIPPLAGFIGKYYVFASAIQGRFFTLAVVAALNSAVAAFYYFKVVRLMYLTPPKNRESLVYSLPLFLVLIVTLAGTLAMGVFPSPFIEFVQRALIL